MTPYNPSKVDLGLNVWQIGLLDVVLLEYPDKSHNFTNLIFMTSSLLNSIVVDLWAVAGPGLIGHVFLIYSYAKLKIYISLTAATVPLYPRGST